jgi:hypothetical protein
MSSYGQSVLEKVGASIAVCADGKPECKAGGITLEWATVTAASGDYEVNPPSDGATGFGSFVGVNSLATDYVASGEKFLRFGQVVCKIVGGTYDGYYAPYGTASGSLASGVLSKAAGDIYFLNESVHEGYNNSNHPQAIEGGLCWKYRLLVNYGTVQTVTMTATGGTFTLAYKGQTTGAQAYNVSAANLQTALVGLTTIGAGKATVALSGGVYTITLSPTLGVHEALVLDGTSLTGGSATLAYAADTSNGPSLSEFKAAFPRVRFVNETNY